MGFLKKIHPKTGSKRWIVQDLLLTREDNRRKIPILGLKFVKSSQFWVQLHYYYPNLGYNLAWNIPNLY